MNRQSGSEAGTTQRRHCQEGNWASLGRRWLSERYCRKKNAIRDNEECPTHLASKKLHPGPYV
jgi:hypothetical protein